ncbi:osmotically inducible protein C [Thermococcus chitonophagus]|uniref:Osmotically inducible protein C n=1 Tax=Thermococcus chitonophagus TaxID=54262 RepID=A0A2Z2N7G4_9EURY|nr:OsmC family protein [Thermococcus chitonophagus]ASJ17574.1 osmotically inducible protein C [Thermococcus chitonophagus]
MAKYKDLEIKVVGKAISPTKTSIKAGDYEIVMDKLGGEAPSPIEYVLAALIGCINIVGHMVAKDMGFEIRNLEIEVTGIFNPAKFMGQDGDRAGFKSIKAVVKVDADADEETLKKWLEKVEERCPVSDNLVNPTPTEVVVKKV